MKTRLVMPAERGLQILALTLAAAAAAADGLAAQPVFQSDNVTLLGRNTPARPGASYSDVWGFVGPDGNEWALVCSTEGVHVIDCSDPSRTRETGIIRTEASGSLNQWRDVKVHGSYAYSVSQAYAGMQIIDLSDPDRPAKVGVWGTAVWNNAHNLAVDEKRGHLWVLGTDTGTHILDIASDPRSPQQIYTIPPPLPYTFDVMIQGDRAYMADLWGNALLIYDVTQLPQSLPLLGFARLPGPELAHSAWPTRDGRLVVTSNEAAGSPLGIFDIDNVFNPQLISVFRTTPQLAPQATPHHVYVRDRLVHVSNWTEGYRLIDLSDPTQPTEIGYFDTYTGPQHTGYRGAWGCYTGLPSGIVLVSDTVNGLFLLKPRATAARYGDETADVTSGIAPRIHAFGAPYLGNPGFKLQADRAPAGAAGVLMVGGARGSTPLLGVELLVSFTAPNASVTMLTSASGEVSAPLPLPNQPGLDGAKFRAQFLFVTAAGVTCATTGLELELFNR